MTAGQPASGYTWPQFQPGHTVNLVHGADHEMTIKEQASKVHAEIRQVAPWLAEDHFAPAVQRYLRAAAREQLLDEHIAKVAADKGPGAVPSRTWEQVTAAARLASKLGTDLGLDPIGHARLKAIAVSVEATQIGLADLLEQGRESRMAAEARMAGTPADSPGVPLELTDVSDGADDDVSGS